jgi:mRNA interferase MazF
VTVCPLTTDPAQAPLFRIEIRPHPQNGLHSQSRLMVDKITTVPRAKLGTRVGLLTGEDMVRLNRAVILFLNLLETA